MKKLFSLILFFSPLIVFSQASKLISTQSAPRNVASPNYVWVDLLDTLTGGGGQYRLYVAAPDSVKIKWGQMRWLKDSVIGSWGNAAYAQLLGAYTNPSFVNSLAAGKVFGLSTVATSGNYSDLTGLPNLSLKYDASNPSGYINGITSGMVTAALGFTPYNATNPNNYITSSSLSSYYLASNPNNYISSYTETDPLFNTKFAAKTTSDLTEGTNKYWTASLSNGALTSSAINSALGYTPYNSSNPAGYITSAPSYSAGYGLALNSNQFRVDSTQIMTVTKAMDTITSLNGKINGKQPQLSGTGFVKASGTTISYDNSTYLTSVPAQSFASLTGKPTTISGYGITDATSNARSAISLTTSGTSGAATYNSTTGVLNVPTYATPSVPTFNNAPARSLNTAYQISTTKNTRVSYSVTCVTALSLLNLNGTAQAFLEISADGSTNWITLNGAGIARTLSVSVTIGLNDSNMYNLQAEVPSTYYCRIRTVTAGTGSTVTFTSGQEVQY